MAAGALARAARRQGQRGLLAWRAALAELQAPAQVRREQQAEGSWLAAAAGLQQQQQQACGLQAVASTTSSGIAAAAGAAGLAPAGPLALPWLREQRRGMALNFARYQPRRKQQQEERNLPAKNEEIKAPEASCKLLACRRRRPHAACSAGCRVLSCPGMPAKSLACLTPLVRCPLAVCACLACAAAARALPRSGATL